MFEFPTYEQLQRCQNVIQKGTILSILQGFRGEQEFKQQFIRYEAESYIQVKEESQKIDHLMIQFKCCNGIANHIPFLHFVKNQQNLFEISDQNCWHDHNHLEQKETFRYQLKQTNEIKEISQPKQMEQDKKQFLQTQQFYFPLQTQLEYLREFNSKEAIKQAYLKLYQEPQHKGKNIKLDFEQVGSNSAVVNSMVNILFECCSDQHEPAFLSYTSSDGKKYILSKSYNLKHIHHKKQESHDKMQQNQNFEHSQNQNINNAQNYISDKNQEIINKIIQQQQACGNNDIMVEQQMRMYSDNDSKQQRLGGSSFSQEIEEQKLEKNSVKQNQNEAMEIESQQKSSSLNSPLFQNLKPVERGRKSSEGFFKENQIKVKQHTNLQKMKPRQLSQPKFLTRGQRKAWKKENNIISDKESSSSDQYQSQNQDSQLDLLKSKKNYQNSEQNEQNLQSEEAQFNQSSQQSIENQNLQFIFPTNEQLKKCSFGTIAKVRTAIYFLVKNKYHDRIKFHSKTYETKNQTGKVIHNLWFDFDCCQGNQQKRSPFIHYISSTSKNGEYKLKDINQKHDHTEINKSIKSNIKQNQRFDEEKIQRQEKNIQILNSDKKYFSAQIFQTRALQESRDSHQVFMFPSDKDIQQIKPFSLTTIKQDLSKLAYTKRKKIKFHCQRQDKNNLKFYFDCCKGFEGNTPFIHFRFVAYHQIFLIFSSSVWHDHRKEANNVNGEKNKSLMLQEKVQSLDKQKQNKSLRSEDQIQNSNDKNQSLQSNQEDQQQINSQESQNQQQKQSQQNSSSHQQQSQQEQQKNNKIKKSRKIKKPEKKTINIALSKSNSFKAKNEAPYNEDLKPEKGYQIRAYWASKKKRSTVFRFPQDKQLKRLDQRPLASIRSTISKLVKSHKNKGVKYFGQIKETIDKNNKKVHNYTVNFDCCQGFQNQKPILHFVRTNNCAKYRLVEVQKWHDHSQKRIQKKSNFSKQENMNYKKIEKLFVNKKQNQIKSSIIKVVQEMGQNLSDRKIFRQSHIKTSNPPQKIKQIFKAPIQTKSIRSSKDQKFVTPPRKNQNGQYLSSEKLNYEDQQQRSIIEIHSQTESQNQQINSYFQANKRRDHLSSSQVKKQHHMTDRNEKTENFLSRNVISINNGFGVHNQNQIFYWLYKYDQKLSNLLLQNKLKNRTNTEFRQQMKNQFYNSFSSNSNDQNQNQSVWMKCICKMMKQNQIEIMKIIDEKTHRQKQNYLSYQNLLFLKKIENINKLYKTNGEFQIYLAVYPIKIDHIAQPLKILLAYSQTSSFIPQILWFFICKEYSAQVNLEDFLEDNQQIDFFYQAFKESIKYFKLENTHVNFIFTTLDYQLITGLDKICQSSFSLNSQKKFSSTMHLSCIDKLMKTQNISQNSQLGNQIKMRFKKSLNFSNVKASYKALKNILKNDEIQSENFVNPRFIYDHYKTFTELFSNQNSYESFQFTAGLFSSELLYKKSQKTMIQDPISQLNIIYTQFGQFNHIAEVFVLIIKSFDPTQRKLLKLTNNTSIIPSKLYETQKQCQNFYQISQRYKESQYSIEKILAETSYELSLIIQKCPRFIIQTTYRLIIAINQLTLKRQNQYPIPKSPKLFQFKDNLQNDKIYKVSLISHDQQKKKNQQPNKSSMKKDKKWQCECKFYMKTGIPCEHQVFAALVNKDSLFNEINQCWKCERR